MIKKAKSIRVEISVWFWEPIGITGQRSHAALIFADVVSTAIDFPLEAIPYANVLRVTLPIVSEDGSNWSSEVSHHEGSSNAILK
jgi:hypothetical protein